MKEIFATAGCMLNICYADWCPNAVVEALVAGIPVICTKGHGVSEIVKDSGIIVDIDHTIDKKHFFRATNKPIKNIQPVYDALDKVLFTDLTFPKPEHLYIQNVARQYYEAIKESL
jgi:glycosyltransferase involved in cell wall biosynthesis